MYYPLKFEPIYYERVWGGKQLRERYNRDVKGDHIGESWDVTCHKMGVSQVINGPLKGQSLGKLFEEDPKGLVGSSIEAGDPFPLLIKIIDAKERLSLQVHPQDAYAKIHEAGELGKCEMWYVLKAKEGAHLVAGLKPGVTQEAFEQGIEQGHIEPLLNTISVKQGDVLYIPAGLIHAITEDIMVAEIQQNSDTVYRVYDWNRVGLDGKPRALHIQKALDVSDFKGNLKTRITKGLVHQTPYGSCRHLVANPYFLVNELTIEQPYENDTNDLMHIYMCLEGKVQVLGGGQAVNLEASESVLLPANLGHYAIVGLGILLETFVPIDEPSVLNPLLKEGFNEDEVRKKMALSF